MISTQKVQFRTALLYSKYFLYTYVSSISYGNFIFQYSANGLMVAHHASCVIDDATTTVHNNTHRKYSKHFCGGGGGENCNRTTSSSPKTTTNLKSRSCKHSRSTSTSPLKRCNNMLQPTITTNTVSIFEDEDIPHYHS